MSFLSVFVMASPTEGGRRDEAPRKSEKERKTPAERPIEGPKVGGWVMFQG